MSLQKPVSLIPFCTVACYKTGLYLDNNKKMWKRLNGQLLHSVQDGAQLSAYKERSPVVWKNTLSANNGSIYIVKGHPDSACAKHTCFPQVELNLKHIFFLLMDTWNVRLCICLVYIMSSVNLWDNSINTQNRAVSFWDGHGLKRHVDASSRPSQYGTITHQMWSEIEIWLIDTQI